MAYKCKNNKKILNQLFKVAFSQLSSASTSIMTHCELGMNKTYQGSKFTHKNNYQKILKDLDKIYEIMALMHNISDDDDLAYCANMSEENFKAKLDFLKRFYHIDE